MCCHGTVDTLSSAEIYLSDEVKAVAALESEMRQVYALSSNITAKQNALLDELRLYSMEQMRCATRIVALEDAMRKLLTPL